MLGDHKMTRILSLIFSLFLFSCIAPRDKRGLYDRPFQENGSENLLSSSGNDGRSPSSVSQSTTGNESTPIESEVQHCRWSSDGSTSFENESNELGEYTACQSNLDLKRIYIQLKNSMLENRLCVIPTYTTPKGRSIFLGEAKCQFIDSNTKKYIYNLIKNRNNGEYRVYTINSIMIIKDKEEVYNSPYVISSTKKGLSNITAFFLCITNLEANNNSNYCKEFQKQGHYVNKKFN